MNLVARLRAAGCVFAEAEAALIVADGRDVDDLVARRVAGEPLELVLGWAEFRGLRILVAPGVFVPRRRSELLAAEAVRVGGSVVVDLCCGTGALACAVLEARPGTEVHAADVAPAAVACARRNVEPRDGHVHEGDLFAALPDRLRGQVDVLVANAPYVPTEGIAFMPPEARLHEPTVALDGGPDGVSLHRRIAAGAVDWLAPGGTVLIETSEGQASLTAELLAAQGFTTRVVRDDDLDATVVIGV